jgi:hypothetical protein
MSSRGGIGGARWGRVVVYQSPRNSYVVALAAKSSVATMHRAVNRQTPDKEEFAIFPVGRTLYGLELWGAFIRFRHANQNVSCHSGRRTPIMSLVRRSSFDSASDSAEGCGRGLADAVECGRVRATA